MSEKFKAIVLNQSGDKFSREIKTLDKSFLEEGDILVKIDYSDLNFKDAMILKNGGKLIEIPHTKGISSSALVQNQHAISITPDIRRGSLAECTYLNPLVWERNSACSLHSSKLLP